MRERVVSRMAEAWVDDDIAEVMARTQERLLGMSLQDTLLLHRRSPRELEPKGRRVANEKLEALSPEDQAKVDEVCRLVRDSGFTTEEREELFAQAQAGRFRQR